MGVNVGIIFALFLLATQAMGFPHFPGAAQWKRFPGNLFKKKQALPIQNIFKLPAAIPAWPPDAGNGFASGIIDLGGLQVSQISTFNKVWSANEGGPDNQDVTVFEPTGIPQGFFMLGSYSQPNNKALFGWVLVAKDVSSSTSNGALLYKKGEESKPIPIAQNGTNLPQDPNNDGAYWVDLPADDANKERVKKGDLQSSKAYIHVKPMLGGTFTDIAMWVFYPFNGPARAKVEFFTINLGKIGEHVVDWEHVTLRVSNFNGQLWEVYFSQHSKGEWVEASQLEFRSGNKPVVYSSLHGHASYPHTGLVLQGSNKIGIRNDTASSNMFLDMGAFELISAEYLGSAVIVPPWLNYFREWGPKIDYNIDEELKKVEKILPGKLKSDFEKTVKGLPREVLGEQGPTGPKVKNSWSGDEV